MNQEPSDQVPRGMEELLKRAATDNEFRKVVLAERGAVAHRFGLTLDAVEIAMLDAIPEEQLVAMIENVRSAPQWVDEPFENFSLGGIRPDRPWWRRLFG